MQRKARQSSAPKELRELVLEEYFNTEKTARELGEYYGVSLHSIHLWAYKQRKKSRIAVDSQESVNFTPEPEKQEDAMKSEMSSEEKDHRIAELEKALEYEQMKVVVLNKMIEITEREFKIPVRKKYGAKQSEK